jgi:hypothetical protein
MKIFLSVTLGLIFLGTAAFYFSGAEPFPEPLIPSPSDPEAARALQLAIDENYCAEAQQILGQTDVAVINEIQLNLNSFINSKSSVNPLTTHQFLHYLPVEMNWGQEVLPAIVSCKLKTAERINHYDANANAGPDLSCRTMLERDVNEVLRSVDAESLAFQPDDIVYDDDEMASLGPTWLAPWPYAVARKENGNLVWQSKALIINNHWWYPMPARWLGTHYCHLPTPQYIRAVLVGDVKTLLAPFNAAD